MKIFIVNGQGGAGKDTFEEFVGNCCCNGPAAKVSMVSYVKQIAEKFGWTGTKTDVDRLMLSRLKDLLSDWDDSPFKTTVIATKQMEKDGVEVCFIDAREPEDIKRLKEYFNCQTILVRRGEEKSYGNHADDQVFSIDYDIEINNNGTLEDLEETALTFYNTYII